MGRDGLWFLWIHNIDKLPQEQERVCTNTYRLACNLQFVDYI